MSCPFCAIVRGELHASIVGRAPGITAFLDARPVFKGHVLVVPDEHVELFTSLTADQCGALLAFGQRVALALEKGLEAQGAFVALNHRISQSVPHAHLHVVPRRKGDGLRGFFWPRTTYESDAERDEWAARIAAALDG